MHPTFNRSPLLTGNDAELKRREIRDYFHATYDRYEQLFEVLASNEAYYKKPIPLRHPLIFYLGHTATFFINKLILAGLLKDRINPKFESLFAVGVDEMSWDDLSAAHYDLARSRQRSWLTGKPCGQKSTSSSGTPRCFADRLAPSVVDHPDGHRT